MVFDTRPPEPEIDWIVKLADIRSEFSIPNYMSVLAANAKTWSQEISVGPFWTKAKTEMAKWRTEYRTLKGGDLLPRPVLPDFESKTEASIHDKLIRKCKRKSHDLSDVVGVEGPPIPKLNDFVRTRVACRYIDGVDFLAKKLMEIGAETNCVPQLRREGRIEGYFAQHITLEQNVIFRLAGHEQLATINCEIQLASELATRVWQASHPLYEEARMGHEAPEEWQWKPNEPRFMANQLGHMIHLVDGLLVQLRDTENSRGNS